MKFDLDKLSKQFNKIETDNKNLNNDLQNIVSNVCDTKESREFKYQFLNGFELLYQKENDKYHDLIDSFSKAYLNMSREIYVGEDLPRDYLNEIDELYSLFVLSFLFKYELEYIWENRIQIELFFKLLQRH